MPNGPNETLERIARRVRIPEPAYERILQRRDRKRRNQRIAAGFVGFAVFVAAVLIVGTAAHLIARRDLLMGRRPDRPRPDRP